MNWIKKYKLLAIEAIQYISQSYIKLDDLWQAIYLSFNSAQDHQIDSHLLKEIPSKKIMKWNPFSKEKLTNMIKKCNNFSAPRLDKLSWRHLKRIIKDIVYLNKFINITNMCIDISY